MGSLIQKRVRFGDAAAKGLTAFSAVQICNGGHGGAKMTSCCSSFEHGYLVFSGKPA